MLDYAAGGAAPTAAGAAPVQASSRLPPPPGRSSGITITDVLAAAGRRKVPIAALAILGAFLGYAAAKVLTPRYVATSEIYVDPGNIPGGDKQALAPGQDSSGFVSYVESQLFVIRSRPVIDRVVIEQKLQDDPEFSGRSWLSSLLGKAGDPQYAGGTLASRITLRRPERTFVIDISVSAADAQKAAQLADAVAKAYVATTQAMQADIGKAAAAGLSGRIEELRRRVEAAERKVEDYKTANGLVGSHDLLVSDQQLKAMNEQLVLARTKATEAKAHADLIDGARRTGDIGAVASQGANASLSNLRAQQAEARQKLADLLGDLGPRHPQVIEARARLGAAESGIVAELNRFAQAQHIEYERAHAVEVSLSRQLEGLKKQTTDDGRSGVGLRDLERQAEAARAEFQLFLARSRESGEIQQIEPLRVRILSTADVPAGRAFPPSAATLAAGGGLLGLILGLALVWLQETLRGTERRPIRAEAASRDPKAHHDDGPRELVVAMPKLEMEARRKRQTSRRIDLKTLGFPVPLRAADDEAFAEILRDAGAFNVDPDEAPRLLVVVGDNSEGARTALSLNLALAAANRDIRVALVDATTRNARLTRAVRKGLGDPLLENGPFFETDDDVLLALPKSQTAEDPRPTPIQIVHRIADFESDPFELIICDGPEDVGIETSAVAAEADKILRMSAPIAVAPSSGKGVFARFR